MTPAAEARCTYVADCITTKLRCDLTTDHTQRNALRDPATTCPDTDLE
ncbi:hypothetical protein [Streptomyces sp. NPDC101150]